jgi:hypothetical protein
MLGLLTAIGFKYPCSIGRQLPPKFGDFSDLPSMMLSRSVAGKRLTFFGLLAVFLHNLHATPLQHPYPLPS